MVHRLVLLLVLFFTVAGCFNRAEGADEKKVEDPPNTKETLSAEQAEPPCLDLFYNVKHFNSGNCTHVDHRIEFQKDDSTATVRNDDEDRYPTIICRCVRPTENKIVTDAIARQITSPPRCSSGICQ